MGNSKENICRICFTKIKDNLYKFIEDIHKEMLEVVVKKLDWELSVDPVICEECITKLHDSFSFKSNCIYVEDFLTPYITEQKHEYLKDERKKEDDNEREKTFILDIPLQNEHRLCRLCIAPIAGNEIHLSEVDKERFKKYLPEINACSNLIDIVCSPCFDLLQNYFNFSEMCFENESKLEAYCKTIRRKCNRKVVLEAFLKYAGETSNTSERNARKEQFGVRQMPDGRFGCPVCSFVTKYLPYMRVHILSHESGLKMYKCPECPLETKYEDVLKKHIKTKHSDDAEIFACDTCSFTTKHKISLRRHVITHKENTIYKCDKCTFHTKKSSTMENHVCKEKKTFNCELCPYKSLKKRNLKCHLLIHKKPLESELMKCKVCEFRTPRRSTLKKHEKIHDRDDNKMTLHKCPHCIHETFGILSLYNHLHKVHDRPKKQSLKNKYFTERHIRHFKCPICDFASKTGNGLANHATTKHGNVKLKISHEKKKFKCDICDYQTPNKHYFKLHQVKHKEIPDEEMHKCDKCSFKTKWASVLKSHHQVRHSNFTFKCPMCSFETKHRKCISQHINVRHGLRTKLYKCKICSFSSKWLASIINHQSVHKAPALKCTKCDFKTRYPKSLRNHLRDMHNSLAKSNVKPDKSKEKFQCACCPFETDNIRGLSVHINRKHKESVNDIYECDQCPFSTKNRSTFTNHSIIHRDVPQEELFKCELCEFKSKYERSLRNHISNRHSNECQQNTVSTQGEVEKS
ncbi:unnamed protein product [Phaedon cochleariae]|uniref:Protein hunchback n=1 Tax=Phaedon cochleariae TaxID=80249 RepID=A0A9N9SFK2_PHACE|nr:unnamed protein product [Phaedon cochleariae]